MQSADTALPAVSSLSVSPSPSNPGRQDGGPSSGDASVAWIAAPVIVATLVLLLVCAISCVCLLRVARRVNRKRVRVQPHALQFELGPIPGVPLSETMSVASTTATPSITSGCPSDQLLDGLNCVTNPSASLEHSNLELKSDWTFDAIEDLDASTYLTQGDHDIVVTRQNAYPMYAKISTPARPDRSRRGKDQAAVSYGKL